MTNFAFLGPKAGLIRMNLLTVVGGFVTAAGIYVISGGILVTAAGVLRICWAEKGYKSRK